MKDFMEQLSTLWQQKTGACKAALSAVFVLAFALVVVTSGWGTVADQLESAEATACANVMHDMQVSMEKYEAAVQERAAQA